MESIKTILASNRIGTIATLNSDGSPWATPVHIFADDEAVYWFSKETHQHSVNIERDPQVSVSLWSQEGETKGACIAGRATKLSADDMPAALEIVVSEVGKIPPVFKNTSAYRVPVGPLDTSRSGENRWYFYT